MGVLPVGANVSRQGKRYEEELESHFSNDLLHCFQGRLSRWFFVNKIYIPTIRLASAQLLELLNMLYIFLHNWAIRGEDLWNRI